ncbi:hypothetical protein BS630_15850 [Rhizobium laguerreae]|nr:hypothetical protein BS630_15850 [Rhizobium laguerreae]
MFEVRTIAAGVVFDDEASDGEHIGEVCIAPPIRRDFGNSRVMKSETKAAAGGRVHRDPGSTAADFELRPSDASKLETIRSKVESSIIRDSNFLREMQNASNSGRSVAGFENAPALARHHVTVRDESGAWHGGLFEVRNIGLSNFEVFRSNFELSCSGEESRPVSAQRLARAQAKPSHGSQGGTGRIGTTPTVPHPGHEAHGRD